MATTPTQRTLRELRNQGRRCQIVERWNAYVGAHGVRQDLFGIIDVIALDPQRGVVGVQSCGQAFAAHEHKLLEERAQECVDWLRPRAPRSSCGAGARSSWPVAARRCAGSPASASSRSPTSVSEVVKTGPHPTGSSPEPPRVRRDRRGPQPDRW